MIIDILKNSSRYFFIGETVKRGMEFLTANDLRKYPDGVHHIDGDRLFVVISTYATVDETEKTFEAHRKYIDIQTMLTGSETIYWAPLTELLPHTEYSKDDDIILFKGANTTPLPLQKDYFCIFFPEDAHKPGCIRNNPQEVRKAVVKVLL